MDGLRKDRKVYGFQDQDRKGGGGCWICKAEMLRERST